MTPVGNAPAALTADERRHIIGVQGNVWTEHIREQDNVGYAVFPRAAALAELGWSPAVPKLQDIVASAWRWHEKHPHGCPD